MEPMKETLTAQDMRQKAMLNQKFSSGTKKEKWELGGAEKESGRREKKSVEDREGEGRGREERKGTEGPLSRRLHKWSAGRRIARRRRSERRRKRRTEGREGREDQEGEEWEGTEIDKR